MLLQLHVENYALADKLTLEFVPHLNVLTGETGAGKSILIDAIRFVLGERADNVRLRSSEKSCLVEAVFEISEELKTSEEIFSNFMSNDEDVLILRREYTPQGKSKVWINNRVANVTTLKELGSHLLDIHGQYDHQLLFDPETHQVIVDQLGDVSSLLQAYQVDYKKYAELQKKRREILSLQGSREREMDLLKYQIEELERIKPKAEEEDELKTERTRLANSEKLYELASSALLALEESDVSVSSLLSRSYRDLEGLVRLDESLAETKSEFEDSQIRLEETVRSLRDYRDNLSFDPDRLQEIDDRLNELELVKRKYGGSLEAAVQFFEEACAKFDKLENSEVYEKEIDRELEKILPSLQEQAKEITAKRKKTVSALKKVIETELKDLQIPDAKFEAKFEKIEFGGKGQDSIEFMMSLNAGQPLRELRKIISGGEVSRVMLAIKKALMKVDPVECLIFDEIDANIGGRLGTITGKKLQEIAKGRQVLLVTHLPQIASFADRHFKVSKVTSKGKAIAQYQLIDGEDRVQELAQMMSGLDETDISKKHAEEMLSRVSR